VDELGPRMSEVLTHSYSFQTGVEYSFLDTWELDFGGFYAGSRNKNTGVSGYANKEILSDRLSQDPNFFQPFSQTKSDISDAEYNPWRKISSQTFGATLLASGELFDWGQGPVALAAGGAAQWMSYGESNDAVTASGAQWGGGTSGTGSGSRHFQSLFAELSLNPLNALEIQLAARFDRYQDFGRTINPKVAIRYKPIDKLLIRGSYGTGFRAPTLFDLYSQRSVSFPFGLDPQDPTETPSQFQTIVGGNTNLKEERTQSINLGFVAEPEKGISFSSDYYRTSQDNVVGSGSLRNIFDAEQRFGNDYLRQFGLSVIRDSNGRVSQIFAPSTNLSTFIVSGLDTTVTIRKPVAPGLDVLFGAMASTIFEYQVEPFPGLGIENQAGFNGIPWWRARISTGLSTSTHNLSFTARGIGKQDKSINSPGTGKNEDYWEFDVRLGYNAPWGGSFFGGVRNVFGFDRPNDLEYAGGDGRINGSLYDLVGRAFFFNYTHDL